MKPILKTLQRTALLFTIAFGMSYSSYSQTPFVCPPVAFQVAGSVSLGNVSLYSYNINTGERVEIAQLGRSINAIAYNTTDNMIWGFDQNSKQMVRIDATGAVTAYTIPNLPPDIYNSADFLPDGYMLFYRTDTGTTTQEYFVVDLKEGRSTYLQLVDPTQAGYPLATTPFSTTMSQLTLTNDMAYNPTYNVMVGVGTGANDKKIVTLNPSTGVVNVVATTVTGDGFETTQGPYGAAFVDAGSNNTLYIFANNPGSYYRIDMATNQATLLSNSIGAGNNDGASCPTALLSIPISGNVFNDTSIDDTVNGTGTNVGSLNAVLYDNTTGKVLAVQSVNADGSYSFGATPGNDYSVYLTTTSPTVGQSTPPTPTLPAGYSNTGENLGATAGNDGFANGVLALGVVSNPTTNVNFGIRVPIPFTCEALAYQVAGPVSLGPVSLYSYNINSGERVEIAPLGRSINAIAYNPVDNMIWGFDQGSFQIVKIEKDGFLTSYTIPNLPNDIYNSADFLPGGYLLFYRTDSGTSTLTYYVVDLNPARPATYLKLVDPTQAGYPLESAPFGTTMSQLTLTNDMVYNANLGLMVGVGTTGNNRKIVTLDPATGVVSVNSSIVTGDGFETTAGAYGAAFVDAGNSNNVFIFANNPGAFYEVNLTTNKAVLLSNSGIASNNDGASCPTAVLSVTISGNVFNDATQDNTTNGTGVNPGGLNAVLYDNTSGKVVGTHPVNSDGTYSFGATPSKEYSVYITTANPAIGEQTPPTPSLPAGWYNRGEHIGTSAGNDGITNGILVLGLVTADVNQVNFGITTESLPVDLVDFSVKAEPNGSVLVTWETTWEEGNKGFIIERSKDSKTFVKVGEVNDVAGSSKSSNDYIFVDTTPYKGTSYYRLCQIDLDGTVNVYRIKSVIVDAAYEVYPNPLNNKNELNVTLDEPAAAIVKLYSVSGREIAVKKINKSDNNLTLVPSTPLTSGIYIITVTERGATRSYRLLVN